MPFVIFEIHSYIFSFALDTILNNQSWQLFDIINFAIHKKIKKIKKNRFGFALVCFLENARTQKKLTSLYIFDTSYSKLLRLIYPFKPFQILSLFLSVDSIEIVQCMVIVK